jgi:hypothetical protein
VLEFMLGDHRQDWLDAGLAELDVGDIGAICAAARVFPLAGRNASELGTTLSYLEHNAHRMHYAHFKKLGMFIGSGAVEAGCKMVNAGRGRHPHPAVPQASGRWKEILTQSGQTPAA